MIDIKHFYGMTKEPFSQKIKLEDLYTLPGLPSLLERFEYAVQLGAISLITGEVGSGKSTSLRFACSKFHPGKYKIVSLVATSGSMMELIRCNISHYPDQIFSHTVGPFLRLY